MKTNLRNILLTFLICHLAASASAQYKPADAGSTVQFKIKNLGFNTNGSFTGLDGDIRFDPATPADAHFDVSIDAASVNTDNTMRDNHLREDGYFDVKKYPRIRFVSTSVTPSGQNARWLMLGQLTIKDQTRQVSFPFTATPAQNDFLFTGSFKINRKDFGVGGSSTIASELEVSLKILAKKS